MSPAATRALTRMRTGVLLTPTSDERGFAIYPRNDRRRRPLVRLSAEETRALCADGAIEACGEAFALSEAGRARLRRDAAGAERWLAQHAELSDRVVADGAGLRITRGLKQGAVMARLQALRDANGAPWLDAAELAAAAALRRDWEASQTGLVRGSEWTAPPRSGATRGPASAQEAAMAKRCDARRRFADALDKLAPPLRRVVESVCIDERGVEALERAEGWPARSGKLALKLGLAQLAAALT